ncbi:co-chaperone DjlA [Legionella longbeachae]|uniref:Co-chaperone protein DjlA n=1 Tax=Legionella longbeachae serogroup 1 (strain NSW150) TaxID=661367 RepID=D3HPS4_LEGLN|nr:co-chaperone DjlA [Legionella longbeachae]VEE01410.1 molecular chaperone DnaJ [Legionella oakridgensis]HBD7396128.1 co-chaperone DjlA [Legionella pneumophila]ARB92226.1 co-chaperone DjlA [Legionella longbeachae]ARM34593.1 co-chaperone DjlA [Legionella longbeachae]EEZ96114.1 DnaJ domain protein [Legionella longbeachae D-4968]
MTFRDFFIITTWWGKIIGACFGYLIAGPTGTLFGLLIGNFFDRGLSQYYSNPHWYYYSEKRKNVQKTFFEATFSIMGHLAKADGRVTEAELDIARQFMDEMRLSREQKNLAKHLFNEGKQPGFNLNEILEKLKKSCKDNRDLLRLFLDIQYRAALTDGFSTKKIQILDIIFSKLDFAPLHRQYRFYEDFGTSYSYEQPREDEPQSREYSSSESYSSYSRYNYQSTKTNLDYAYALLEISPNASKQEVKRAYRRLLSRNHPDKLIAQGLPQEMIKIANEKTQKIVKAYEIICSSKGW